MRMEEPKKVICKNCKGKGEVSGARKLIRDKGFQPKLLGKCLYCKGIGYFTRSS